MSNTIAMNVPTDAELEVEVKLALADNSKASKLVGSAEQRFAYCIMVHHMHLVDSGKKLASLASILTSDEARKDIQSIMLARFAPPLTKEDQGRTDAARNAQFSHGARVELIKRSLKDAACLAKGNVQLSDFNRKTGVFTVPVDLLLFPGQSALGRLRKVDTTLLDGQAFNLEFKNAKGNDDYGKATASTTRLREVNVTVVKRNKGSTPDETKGKVKNEAVDLARALAKRLEDDAAITPKAAQADSFWNDLEMVMIWYDRQKSHPDFLKPLTPAAETKAEPAKVEPVKAPKVNGTKNKAA